MTHPEIEAVLRGDSRWCVVEGDNADYRASFPKSAAIISDPPYGMKWNTDSTRFSGGVAPTARAAYQAKGVKQGRDDWSDIKEDSQPFDPAPWLGFDAVALWGANHYSQRLPVGTTLVWVKKAPHLYGTFLSDAEVAWENGGHGVYCFEVPSHAFARMAENDGKTPAHPTQKPIALMEWCIQRQQLPPDSLIIDPYCGSGTTGVAAIQLGHRFIGIEREPQYCAIARRRIADAAAQGSLF